MNTKRAKLKESRPLRRSSGTTKEILSRNIKYNMEEANI